MVWLTPTIISARGGSHCSTKSRRLTLPAQQPRSQASWSSSGDAGGGANSGVAAGATGTAVAACAGVAKVLEISMAQATTMQTWWLVRFIGIRSSLWPRERQVQQQILRFELEPVLAIDGHRQVDGP